MLITLARQYKNAHHFILDEIEYKEENNALYIRLPEDYLQVISQFEALIKTGKTNPNYNANSLARSFIVTALYNAYLEGRHGLVDVLGDFNLYPTGIGDKYDTFIKGNGPDTFYYTDLKETGFSIDHKTRKDIPDNSDKYNGKHYGHEYNLKKNNLKGFIDKTAIGPGKWYMHSFVENGWIVYFGVHGNDEIVNHGIDCGAYWELHQSKMMSVLDFEQILLKNCTIRPNLAGLSVTTTNSFVNALTNALVKTTPLVCQSEEEWLALV